jgi:hypothetical protein
LVVAVGFQILRLTAVGLRLALVALQFNFQLSFGSFTVLLFGCWFVQQFENCLSWLSLAVAGLAVCPVAVWLVAGAFSLLVPVRLLVCVV